LPNVVENELGFGIQPNVLAADEVSGLIAALDGVGGRSRAGARHLMAQPAVAALANDSRLLAVAQRMLGSGAQPYRVTLFDKSPGSNWLVVWHQDTALPLRSRRDVPGWGPWSVKSGVLYAHAPAVALQRIVALRVHLDDSGHENGPLRVLPGTHTLGVLSDAAIHELASQIHPYDCTVPRGGVLSMRPLLVHASSKAVTQASRRVLHIEYSAALKMECELELDVA
jgi:ectoine hydroxylase-related dioxygenase (phytanoyl-CoA dioxygenase family)